MVSLLLKTLSSSIREIVLEQKVKTMSPNELLQSRSIYDNDKNDPDFLQTTLSQYQTPTYLAK